MAIIHDEHCHEVDQKKKGDSGTKNMGKHSNVGFRSSGHKPGGSSSGGGSNMTSDRDRAKSGKGRSLDPSGAGKKSKRETPPIFNTN
jgi:hypothetical protein